MASVQPRTGPAFVTLLVAQPMSAERYSMHSECLSFVEQEKLDHGKGLLHRVISMLVKMTR